MLFNLAGSEADQVNGTESVFDIEQRLVITVVGEPPVWKLIIFLFSLTFYLRGFSITLLKNSTSCALFPLGSAGSPGHAKTYKISEKAHYTNTSRPYIKSRSQSAAA